MNNERDTHFARFASLLAADLEREYRAIAAEMAQGNYFYNGIAIQMRLHTVMAQRAYDLVFHAVYQLMQYYDKHDILISSEPWEVEELIREHIPDATAFQGHQ